MVVCACGIIAPVLIGIITRVLSDATYPATVTTNPALITLVKPDMKRLKNCCATKSTKEQKKMFKCFLCGQITESFNWCLYCRNEKERMDHVKRCS